MNVGLSVYGFAAADLLDLAPAAEEAGFASLWLGEHIVAPIGYTTEHPTTSQAGQRTHHSGPIVSPDTALVDPLVALGALATVTERVELATGIFVLPLRHPLAVARSVSTVQDVAGGRFVLGVGFGWLEEEFDALAVPFGQRVTRFEEAIAVLRAAWRGGAVDHEGRHYSIHGIQVTDRAVSVPLVLGGNTERALRRAARMGDGWISSGTPSFEEAVRLRDELRRLRQDSEQAGKPFRLIFRMAGTDALDARRYDDAGFADVLIWADQVWPRQLPHERRREALFTVANTLGVGRH